MNFGENEPTAGSSIAKWPCLSAEVITEAPEFTTKTAVNCDDAAWQMKVGPCACARRSPAFLQEVHFDAVNPSLRSILCRAAFDMLLGTIGFAPFQAENDQAVQIQWL